MQTKKVEVCTPAEFFKITAVRETPHGSIIMFQNGQVGVLVRLERGTVVGRPDDFMGEHYDAMSEMFRALLRAKLKFLIMDVCESTGNESTVDALGRLTVNSTNKNINKLMELQVGYIKTLVNDTIYSKDYLLIYTEASRVGTLIAEVEEALRMSMDGAIDGYEITRMASVLSYLNTLAGYFSGEDVLRAGVVRKAFKIVGVEYEDGVRITLVTLKGKSLKCKLRALRKVSSRQGKFLYEGLSVSGNLWKVLGFITDIPQAGSGVLFNAVQEAPKTPQNAFGGFGGINPQPSPFGGFTGVSQPNQTLWNATQPQE